MKKITLIIGVLVGLGFLGFAIRAAYLRKAEKSKSPEDKARYEKNDLTMAVFYSRPYKKNREIFGKLVPYGQLWRTGANEATVFANGEDVLVNGQKLKSGRHQLITIPYADHWTIILNSDVPGWGIVVQTGKVYHNVRNDELVFDVPVIKKDSIEEQFTIAFDQNGQLSFRWDDVQVNVPISKID